MENGKAAKAAKDIIDLNKSRLVHDARQRRLSNRSALANSKATISNGQIYPQVSTPISLIKHYSTEEKITGTKK